jgi:hypothetical protein
VDPLKVSGKEVQPVSRKRKLTFVTEDQERRGKQDERRNIQNTRAVVFSW